MSADLIGDDVCREAFNKARQQRFSVHGLDVVCEPDIFRAGYAAGRDSEIAKRDARMAELEKELQAGATAVENCELFRAELAAIKAQEPTGWYTEDHLDDKSATTYSWAVAERWVEKGWPVSPLYAAPVSEAQAQGAVPDEREEFDKWFRKTQLIADSVDTTFVNSAFLPYKAWMARARLNSAPVQQVSVPDVSAMARILADRNADACNVNREDNWAIYGQDYIDDVTAMLAAAPAAPAADACKACKGTGRRPIGGRGRIFGLTNRCFECHPLTDEEVYGTGDSHD